MNEKYKEYLKENPFEEDNESESENEEEEIEETNLDNDGFQEVKPKTSKKY